MIARMVVIVIRMTVILEPFSVNTQLLLDIVYIQ